MTLSKPNQQRLPWIDALKGWGMVLIVVGHVWSLHDISLFYQWLFSFHVPLFFFAAGLTLKLNQGPTWGFMRQRAPSLLVPYIVFGLVGYVFYLAGYIAAKTAGIHVEQFSYGLFRPLWGIAYGSVGDGLLVNSPIWFLPALLICTGLVYGLNRAIASYWLRYAIWLGLFGLGAWVALQVKLPFSAASALCAAIFMQLGLDLKRHLVAQQHRRGFALVALVVLFAITLLAPLNGDVGLAGPTVNHPVLFIALAVAGTLASVALAMWLQPIRGLSQILQTLGRHSMGILVLHMLAIKGIKVVLSMATGTSIVLMEQHVGWGLVVLVGAALLTWLAIVVISKFAPFVLAQKHLRQPVG